MAKKRKRIEERKEEREYKPPEFDRIDYIRTEVGVSKATLVAALFAIPMGLAAVFVMPVGGVGGGLVAGLAGLSFLWFIIPMFKIGTKKFTAMNWAGILSTYFFLFLTVWVIVCNPPFMDMATPEIREVQLIWPGGSANVTESVMGSLEAKIPLNVTQVTVRAQVTDNTAVSPASVMIKHKGAEYMMAQVSESIFEYTLVGVDGFDTVTITAVDTKGNAHPGFSFTVIK